jgi:hypothetical protein
MIVLDCEQNTTEWHEARLAIPTASQFKRIVTPTGKPSGQASDYRMRLHAEWLARRHFEDEQYQNYAMLRGFNLQPQALRWYEMERGVDVRSVGFCFTNDRRAGCSPDGLVGEDGGVEIKCPFSPNHVEFLLSESLPSEYVPQVQGSLWITGRKWWDFVSYHPDLPSAVIRVRRDEEYIAALQRHIGAFLTALDAERKTLTARGLAPMEEA